MRTTKTHRVDLDADEEIEIAYGRSRIRLQAVDSEGYIIRVVCPSVCANFDFGGKEVRFTAVALDGGQESV